MTERFRVEHDSMGDVRVPADARWGAQTQRAVENFPISGLPLEPRLIRAAFLNAVSALLDFGSQLVVALVVTPVLLRSLDSALFGVWKILLQLVDLNTNIWIMNAN